MRKATEIRGHRQPQAAELVHRARPGESKASAWRVDPRYAPLLVSAIMAIVTSLAVSLVETIVRLGFTSSLVPTWLTSFAVAVIVAVPTAVLVAPPRPAPCQPDHQAATPADPGRRMSRALNRKPPSANNGYSIPFPRKGYLR